jgi:DNA-binding response OmpR family regulator
MRDQKKILIIDDDETALIYLSMFFTENDFYVISAKNGKDGV